MHQHIRNRDEVSRADRQDNIALAILIIGLTLIGLGIFLL